MPQQLFVKNTATGVQTPVNIIRTWLSNGGPAIFLHVGGRYAYKDGQPLRSGTELDTLPGAQRERAMAWWNSYGKKESEAYYAGLETQAREAAGDFQPEPAGDASELDVIVYTRRKAGVKTGAVTAPKAWMEWFGKRPDWWGQAREIAFPDYTYSMAVDAEPMQDTAAVFTPVQQTRAA